jgi:acyl-CoA dehydrogenase-like protein
MDDVEREVFAESVGRATMSCTSDALDAALDDLGWRDALAAEPATAVSVLFEAQGVANATSSALDWSFAGVLDGGGAAVPGDAAVVLPMLRDWNAPGRVEDGRCAVRGLATGRLARSDRAVVVAPSDQGHAVFLAETAALVLEPVRGIDPELRLAVVGGHWRLSSGDEIGAADWDATLGLGQLALGHELVGSARAMLELARAHALARTQFGRAIGSFQAVRHRLAESLVAIEAAAALLAAAWDDPDPVTAAMAKGLAGHSARTTARHCQQVLAGIGFTTEHPLHRHVRRTIVLDQLLGAGDRLTRRLGAGVLASGSLPRNLPL